MTSSDPATPANAALTANAKIFTRATRMPEAAALSGASRTACIARPVRLRTMLRAMRNIRAATASTA